MIRNFIGRFFHIFSVASNGTAQLTDCKAASGKDQQRTVWREAAHRYDLPAQGAECFLRPLRKQKVKQQQRKRQMEQPGAVQWAERHFRRADGTHLHQNRKSLYAQCRTAQYTCKPTALGRQITARADFQQHRTEDSRAGGQHFPCSCGQHPEEQDKGAELYISLCGLCNDAVQPENTSLGRIGLRPL